MKHKRSFVIFGMLLIVSLSVFLLLTKTTDVEANSPQTIQPALPSNVAPDTIVFITESDAEQAINRLELGEIDLYAGTIYNPDLASLIENSTNLDAYTTFGMYAELTFNPAGPVFNGTGKLNPFAVPRIRQAMNWLIDREYIVEQLMHGLAVPRWLPLHPASHDYNQLANAIRGLELYYAYDEPLARQIIATEMQTLGATFTNSMWQYDGQPVEIIMLIRTGDQRQAIGDYVADQLEGLGFTVIRNYGYSSVWISEDPNAGLFHIYTGGWQSAGLSRNSSETFAFFYTNIGPYSWSPLWQAYVNTPEFYDLASRLNNNDFATFNERSAMISQSLEWAMEDSVRIWLVDTQGIVPKRQEVQTNADLLGGVIGSWMWPYTIQRTLSVSTTLPMTIASPINLLINPWNPLGGTNWAYDAMAIRATGEKALIPDSFTGLAWPNRFDHAEVYIAGSQPVSRTLPWVDLYEVTEITVPDDAWVGWDATNQRFLTASEVYSERETAKVKSIIYYPSNLTNNIVWHDGSSFSVADVVMNMILTFDRAQEESSVYDPAVINAFNTFMADFRGLQILSEDPLVIEHYTDRVDLDAEMLVTTWWPFYATGSGAWHNLALGLLAEASGEAAFTQTKANANQVEWLNFIAGPSLDILAAQLTEASGTSYIPYMPTLGNYITTTEAETRWANLSNWYQANGHFWIGTGPFYLAEAQPTQSTLTLQRFPSYPDAIDRWNEFAVAPIPEVAVAGPDSVTRGDFVVYTITVTFNGQPYPNTNLDEVSYLLLNSKNNTLLNGEANYIGEGLWQVILDENTTNQLPGGENRLEIVVVTNRIVIPGFASQQINAPYYKIYTPLVLRIP